MAEGYRIKGSSIASKFLFVRERFGETAEKELKQHFDPALFPLLDSQWYPHEIYVQVVKAITSAHLGGDLNRLEEVGIFSAETVLTTIYRFFATGNDFVDFLKRAEQLHESVYNQGGMRVEVAEDRKSCLIHLSGPSFGEIDMHISAGFYLGAARMLGAVGVTCRKTLTASGASFDLSWV